MATEIPLTKDTPTGPAPDRKPEDVFFLNLGMMIFRGETTDAEANQLLDSLGADPNQRFWGCQTVCNPSSGRFSTHYFKWENGGWVNGTKARQELIRKNIGK